MFRTMKGRHAEMAQVPAGGGKYFCRRRGTAGTRDVIPGGRTSDSTCTGGRGRLLLLAQLCRKGLGRGLTADWMAALKGA